MGRTEGRSAQDTRKLVLDAARRAIRRDGLAATLGDIAAEAGISKGGLLYHFESKHELFVALSLSISQNFDALYERHVDPRDQAPGAVARAYIAASFAEFSEGTIRDNAVLTAHLASDRDLRWVAEQDGATWRERLLDDGLSSATVSLIIAACIGVSSGPLWGPEPSPAVVQELEAYLVELTRTDPVGSTG